MADPVKPSISTDYSDYAEANQAYALPGSQLDVDLAELKRAADDTIDALTDVRRPDGALVNGIVTNDSLAPGLAASLTTSIPAAAIAAAEAARDAAQEWAVEPEDDPVSIVAGGDGVTTFSALHHATKAAASDATATSSAATAVTAKNGAQEWANNPEDDPVSVAAGGDDSTTFSAKHWAAKAEASAIAVESRPHLVGEVTFSTSTATAELEIPAGYSSFLIMFQNIQPSEAASLTANLSSDGMAYDTGASDYEYTDITVSFPGPAMAPGSDSAAFVSLSSTCDTGSAYGVCGEMRLFPGAAALAPIGTVQSTYFNNNTMVPYTNSFVRESTYRAQSIRFQMSVGTMVLGTFQIWAFD